MLEPSVRLQAYGPLGGAKVDWPASMCPVGLLSMAEVDHSVPVCDRLKCPPGGVGQRVWILHGRDHFTFCFEAPNLSDDDSGEATPKRGKPSQSPASSEGPRDFKSEGGAEPDAALHTEQSSHRPAIAISLFHWNGLPPAGPRMTEIVVNPRANKNTGGVMEAAPAPKTSKEGVSKFHTPITGQIWDVVQAFPGDKKTRHVRKHELMLFTPAQACEYSIRKKFQCFAIDRTNGKAGAMR